MSGAHREPGRPGPSRRRSSRTPVAACAARFALAVLAGHALGGCGFIRVTTTGPGGGSAAAGGASSDAGEATARAYASWTYASCGPKEWCGVKLAAAAGIRPDGQRGGALENPKPGMTNPDPEWLPGWSSLRDDEDGARDVFEALSLAAMNRTWWAACRKAYGAAKKDMDERVARARSLVRAAQAVEGPYERLGALLALPTRASGVPPKEGELAPGFGPAAFETEQAIVEAFRAQDRLWLLEKEGLALSAAAREALAPRWDPSLEEKAFCGAAARHGLGELPPLPRPGSTLSAAVVEAVKPVLTGEDEEILAKRRGERSASARQALSPGAARAPEGLRQWSSNEGEEITSFTVRGGVVEVVLFRRATFHQSIGDTCVNGRGVILPCPTMQVTKDETRVATFDAWPSGLTLQKGDRIHFYGVSESSKVEGQGTPRRKVHEKIRGLHLVAVKKVDGTEKRYWR